MPYINIETNFKTTRNIFKRKSAGETVKDESLLKAAREIKRLDPSFMPSIKAQTRKLSPQQKGALVRGLKKQRETLSQQIKGRDVYEVPKKSGESKTAYRRRVKKLQRANNQGKIKGNYVTVQNQETALGKKPRLFFDKKGRIQTKYDDGKFEARSVFIPASHIEGGDDPTEESFEVDLREAIEEGRSWKVPPDQVAVAVWGTRLAADSDLVFSWTELTGKKKKIDPDKVEDLIEEKKEVFFQDMYPDGDEIQEEEEDEDGVAVDSLMGDPAAKSYAKKRAKGYDGIWVEYSGEKGI